MLLLELLGLLLLVLVLLLLPVRRNGWEASIHLTDSLARLSAGRAGRLRGWVFGGGWASGRQRSKAARGPDLPRP